MVSQSCDIEAYISYAGGEPCDYCPVQLTKLDCITLLDFNYADSLGYIQFHIDTDEQEILLRASQFGYRDSIVLLSCSIPHPTELNIVLHPLSLDLDEVTIIDKIALLNKNGDTTTFNLKALESGFEISTFDIVQRFPGIEISGNKLNYHGEPLEDPKIVVFTYWDQNGKLIESKKALIN